MTRLIIILLLSFTLTGFSQEVINHWSKTMGSKGYDFPYSATLSNENEVIIATYFEKDSIIKKDSDNSPSELTINKKGTYLIKIDSLGTIISSKQISPDNLIVSAIAMNQENELYIAANYKDTIELSTPLQATSLISKGENDFCLIRLDENTEITNYTTWGNEYDDRVHDMKLLSDGNIILTGFISGNVDLHAHDIQNTFQKKNNDNPSGFIVKLNPDFDNLWVQHFYNDEYVHCKAVTSDSDNNIFITGYFYDNIKVNSNNKTTYLNGNGRLDLFVSKLSDTGKLIWIKNWGHAGYDYAEDIEIDNNNNIYIAASLEINPILNNWQTDHYSKMIHNQASIIKLNQNGEEQWLKSFAGPNAWSSAMSIALDNLGQPIIAGYTTQGADMTPDNSYYYYSSDILDYFNECGFIEALDTEGNFIWSMEFGSKGKQLSNIYQSPIVLSDKNNNIYSTNISYKNEKTVSDKTDNYSNVEIIKLHQCYTTYISMYDTVCESYIDANDDTIYVSGSYMEYLTCAKTGCDSVVTWNITVNPTYYIVKDTTIYEGTDMIVAGEHFTTDETYIEYLVCNYTNCDSTVIWEISVSDSIILSVGNIEEICENSALTIPYSLNTGYPSAYKIIYDPKAIAAGFSNTSYNDLDSYDRDGLITVIAPEKIDFGVYTASIQMKNDNGTESSPIPFSFKIKLSSDYIHYGDINLFLFDNSSDNFIAYQWYKNDELLKNETNQYYYDDNSTDAYYRVRVVTTGGDTMTTCPKYYEEAASSRYVKTYPNPVPHNMTCTTQLIGFENEDLSNYTITIKDIYGTTVYYQKNVSITTTIDLPAKIGLYIGFLTNTNNESYVFKIIKTM